MRRILLSVSFLLVSLLYALPALAGNWGEDWGTMVWGIGVPAVPVMGWPGLLVVVVMLGLAGAYWLRRSSGGLMVPVLLVLLSVPLAVAADTVAVPHDFVDGDPAYASEVNANFDAVEAAVNDNDSRIGAAQATADAAQVRVGGSCPAGSSIRAIAADGTVTCETDTDTDTTYSAGSGLGLAGATFAVNPTQVQSRVTGECPAGESIRRIKQGGAVICETDTDTDTTYSAGGGLILTDTTLSADPSVLQGRVSSECPAGSSIRKISVLGDVVCETDTDTPPQMTSADRDLIGNPATGLIIFNTETNCLEVNVLSQWHDLACASCGPAISADPLNVAISAGASASFGVTAAGGGLTYQWQVDRGQGFVDLTEDGSYQGVTEATLNIPSASLSMGGESYRCVVTGGCDPEVTSNSASLTVGLPCPYTEDFASYGDQSAANTAWPTSDSGIVQVDVGNQTLAFTHDGNQFQSSTHAVGQVSDTYWKLRFKLTITNFNCSANYNHGWHVGLSDSDYNTSANQSQDFIGMLAVCQSAERLFRMADSNNNDIEYRSRSSVGPSPGNGTYYVEIIRESATSYKVEFFSDSSYSGSLGSTTQSIDSTLTDLKYIVWKGSWDQRNESAGYVDDIEFWDGSCF